MQSFGLSCKVFKRTEYRGCVLIGSCHWLRFFILFVAQFNEYSNWFIVPLLATVSAEVNMLILEKMLYYKILSPKIKGSNEAPPFSGLSKAFFFHCGSCVYFSRILVQRKRNIKVPFWILTPLHCTMFSRVQGTELACLCSTWAWDPTLSDVISI